MKLISYILDDPSKIKQRHAYQMGLYNYNKYKFESLLKPKTALRACALANSMWVWSSPLVSYLE